MKRLVATTATIWSGAAVAVLMPLVAVADSSSCSGVTLSSPLTGNNCASGSQGVIFAYLDMVIQFLSGLVGVFIVLMLIIGGVQYITSAGDPGAVKAAKSRITNAIIGLVLFIMMFAILNFLIPGGVFQ